MIADNTADAALIVNDTISAEFTDGNVHVGDSDFGLGDSANPAPQCNPSGAESIITATVGAESGGVAAVSNFNFEFAPGQFNVGGSVTCVQLVVDNEGSVTGSLTRTGATQDGTLTVSGARADVLVNGGPCGIQNVNVTPLSGPVDGDPAVNLASLDTATAFNVPGFSGCGAFQNFILNAFFDVPANNGDLQMDLAISAT